MQLDAIRADRAAGEFRGYPPSAMDQLKSDLGDKIVMQQHDWNCGSLIWFNHTKKPFDDVRVRRALTLALDRWGSAPALSKIALVKTVGSVVFPSSPLAPNKDQLMSLAGYGADIEKSRAEARRLLKEAGQEDLSFELLNRNVDQPYMYNGTWAIDQWSKIGVHVTQKVVPTGPWFAALRNKGEFSVGLAGNCNAIVNPAADVSTYLPASVNSRNYGYYEDPQLLDTYNKMLRETDPEKQKELMFQYRQAAAGRRGAHRLPVVVEPHRAAALLRAWLEDRAEPLHEPGSRNRLAVGAAMRCLRRPPAGGRQTGRGDSQIAASRDAAAVDNPSPLRARPGEGRLPNFRSRRHRYVSNACARTALVITGLQQMKPDTELKKRADCEREETDETGISILVGGGAVCRARGGDAGAVRRKRPNTAAH